VVWVLARKNLRRAVSRTAALVAGVTVAGALLFDMSMLSGGLERSFGSALGRLGYDVRVVLRGTLPLSTDAMMPRARTVAARIGTHPGVLLASPILATTLYVESPAGRMAAVAYGLQPQVRGLVRRESGRDNVEGLVINRELARRLAVSAGDAVRLASRIDPQTGRPGNTSDMRVLGIGDFVFDLKAQRTIALPLDDLQRLLGLGREPASFIVVKTRPGVDPESVARSIEAEFPALQAFSIAGLLEQVRRQLTYFEHFSLVLSGISLLVALLLVGAVLTLSVGERLGELAALRAVGLSRRRAVLLVLLEGALLSAVSTPLALAAGAIVSRPMDAILRSTPGMPQDLHFFVASPEAVVRTALLLALTGTLGAAHPAWIAGRLNIAATLHQEGQ